MIRFGDSNIYKLVQGNSLVSISTESTMSEELAAAAIVIAIISKRKNTERKRKRRTVWVKPWLYQRPNFQVYDMLLSELRLEDENEYKNYLRMTPENFEYIYHLVKNGVTKQNTTMRESIPPKLKLAVTIRFLSTGESYKSLQFQYRIHNSTLSLFIPDVCEAIYKRMKEKYLKECFKLYFLFSIDYHIQSVKPLKGYKTNWLNIT